MLPNPIRKAINQLSLHSKHRLVGSNSLRGNLYSLDYDLETTIDAQPIKKVIDYILNLYNQPNLIITELKAGFDSKGNKITWTKNDILKGEKNNIKFKDALMMRKKGKNTAKIDALVISDDTIEEISSLLLINLGEKQNYFQSTAEDISRSLESDINEYSNSNTLKSLKRLYNLYNLNGNVQEMEKLQVFFNSEYGLLNKIINELKLIDLAKSHNVDQSIINKCRYKIQHQLSVLPANLIKNNLVIKPNIHELQLILNNGSKQYLKSIV